MAFTTQIPGRLPGGNVGFRATCRARSADMPARHRALPVEACYIHSCMPVNANASSSILILAATLCLATSNAAGQWQSLFDGKSLQGWRETPFTGRGAGRVDNGTILLGAGAPMTGVTWTGSFPHSDYE